MARLRVLATSPAPPLACLRPQEKFVAGGGRAGWARKGLVAVPRGFEVPGALLVEKDGESDKDRDYIGTIRLAT